MYLNDLPSIPLWLPSLYPALTLSINVLCCFAMGLFHCKTLATLSEVPIHGVTILKIESHLESILISIVFN